MTIKMKRSKMYGIQKYRKVSYYEYVYHYRKIGEPMKIKKGYIKEPFVIKVLNKCLEMGHKGGGRVKMGNIDWVVRTVGDKQ